MITITKYEEIAKTKDEERFKEISPSLYWAYFGSKRAGSEDINLDDVKWDWEIEPIIKECKEYGIEQLTFSSTWSGAIKIIWEFVKRGCTVVGMKEVPIDRWTINYKTDQEEQEKVPAIIIKMPNA